MQSKREQEDYQNEIQLNQLKIIIEKNEREKNDQRKRRWSE